MCGPSLRPARTQHTKVDLSGAYWSWSRVGSFPVMFPMPKSDAAPVLQCNAGLQPLWMTHDDALHAATTGLSVVRHDRGATPPCKSFTPQDFYIYTGKYHKSRSFLFLGVTNVIRHPMAHVKHDVNLHDLVQTLNAFVDVLFYFVIVRIPFSHSIYQIDTLDL